MSIRSGTVILIAALGFLGATSAMAQTAACTGNGKISKQIAKSMSAAQDAQRARKWQDELAKVREAEATAGAKSEFDKYMMAQFRGYAYVNLNQTADAARELEFSVGSPCMPDAKKADSFKNLVGMYTSLKNYPKAIDFGNRALKVSNDPGVKVALAQAYYQSGNNKESVRLMNEVLNSTESGGNKPKEQQLLLVRAACDKAGDNNCVAKVFEKLVVYYPKPDYWSNLMVSLRKGDTDDLQKLNVLRLSQQVKVMKGAEEYKEFAQLALDEQLGCEAQTVLEQGFTNKVFVEKRDVDVNTRLLTTAKAKAAAEKAGLAAADTASRSAATGDASVKVGAQYLMCGDNAKAVEALQRGITKGGLGKPDVAKGETANPKKTAEKIDEASLLLGIAHIRNNNKSAAATAFRAVKADPTMVRIAKLWLLNT